MIDAAANDARDALAACPCCLLGPQQRCLKTPYTHLDNTEIYSDMLKECFNIQLDVGYDTCGICEECVVRLRDASHFKRQVQRSQRELQERLARALEIKEEAPPAVVKSETADEDRASDNLLDEEISVKMEIVEEDWTAVQASHEVKVEPPANASNATGAEHDESNELEQLPVKLEESADATSDDVSPASSPSLSPHTRAQLTVRPKQRRGEAVMRIHTVEKPFSCTICNKQFTRKDGLKSHIILHTGQKPYSCKICNKTFNKKCNLTAHSRVHTGQKVHSCDICNKQFAQQSDLKRHNRIHTGQKPYVCPICNKQFTQKGSLNMHNRTHAGQKPYTCGVCNKQFTQKGSLNMHNRTHTGEKPFSCEKCNKQFTNQSNLTRHIYRSNPCGKVKT